MYKIRLTYPLMISFFMILFQCVITTPIRESEFTEEQKQTIENYQKRQIELEERLTEFNQWMRSNTGNAVVPSAAVIIMNNGICFYREVFHGDINRLFEMASITKTFIAIAVLQLAERGYLSLDDPVSKFLPIHLENEAIGSPPITILHVLTHTAGLVDSSGSINTSVHPTLPIPEQKYPAGLRFNYCNQGYNLLGFIVPKVAGVTLSEYIKKNILEPLEMNDSKAPTEIAGSAGIKCTANDLTNYLAMFYNRGEFKGNRILSEKSFNKIFDETYEEPPSKYREYRGIAFRIWKIDGKIVSFHHAAHMNGAGGFMQLFPRHGVGYCFISNPPVYDTEDFYRFYRAAKWKLLKISGVLTGNAFSPAEFQATIPENGEMLLFAGKYSNPVDGSNITIQYDGGYVLHAIKSKNGQSYMIQPTSRHTFVYIYPGQSEKGEIYDFIGPGGVYRALCVKDGYYLRQ